MTVQQLRDILQFLLASAVARDTEQGIFIYRSYLHELAGLPADSIASDALIHEISRPFLGISTHGEVTDDEYAEMKKVMDMAHALSETASRSKSTRARKPSRLAKWLGVFKR